MKPQIKEDSPDNESSYGKDKQPKLTSKDNPSEPFKRFRPRSPSSSSLRPRKYVKRIPKISRNFFTIQKAIHHLVLFLAKDEQKNPIKDYISRNQGILRVKAHEESKSDETADKRRFTGQ